MPQWALDILYKCIDPLRAEEATWQTNSSRMAFWASTEGYREQMQKWRNMASPIDEMAGIVVISPKHEQWFIDNSIPYRLAAENAANE